MRNLPKTLCATAALALAALLVLPAGISAQENTVPIDEAHFPDARLRAWLRDAANLDGAGADGLLTQAECNAVLRLDLSGEGLSDLTGIQYFPALERLNVRNNDLTTLDLRQNPRLMYLHCGINGLERLDVTGCGELLDLDCESNNLTALDLSGNPKLIRVYCRNNQLAALDVSHNPALAFIETFDNQLTAFDCSMLKELRFLHIDYNQLTTLDLSHNPALEGNGCVVANNHLQTLTLPDIPEFAVEAEAYYEQNPRPEPHGDPGAQPRGQPGPQGQPPAAAGGLRGAAGDPGSAAAAPAPPVSPGRPAFP